MKIIATTGFKLAMPVPSPQLASKAYYHGTSNETAGISILQSGYIKPPEWNSKSLMAPVVGKVYMTTDINHVLSYVIGGYLMGHSVPDSFIKKDGQFGYLFQIDGKDLVDLQPDEDSVGKMLHNKTAPSWLVYMAKSRVAPRRLREVMQGTYAYWASVGKQLLRVMTPQQKSELMHIGGHVAHHGNVKPSAAWRFDKALTPQLTEDGSNFFEIAEKVL